MINKAILIGNLGADPEVRHTATGDAVTTIRLATSEKWTDRQSGERKEKTEWHRVVFFRRLAEVAGEFLKKGAMVYIEGRIETRKWTDQSGQDRYTTEIVADSMQMLGARPGGQDRAPASSSSGFRGQASSGPADYPADGHAAQQHEASFADFADDDIPF